MKKKFLTGLALVMIAGCSESPPTKPKSSSGGNAPPADGFTDKTAGSSEKSSKQQKVEDSGKKKVE